MAPTEGESDYAALALRRARNPLAEENDGLLSFWLPVTEKFNGSKAVTSLI